MKDKYLETGKSIIKNVRQSNKLIAKDEFSVNSVRKRKRQAQSFASYHILNLHPF
jgi:hypothetical protein